MIVARAPLRISIGGGGTDLPSYAARFGGSFISAAINKYVYICVNQPTADDLIRIKYSKSEQVTEISQIQHDLVGHALRIMDIPNKIEIVSMADVPDGTGMGSSGSYLVSLLCALNALKRRQVPTQALAEQAAHIEMDLAKHPVGKQDHYIAAFGGINFFEVQRDGRVTVTPLNITAETAEALRSSIMLFYTQKQRRSSDILAQQESDTNRDDNNVVESLHETKRIGLEIKDALENGDVERFGRLVDEHWEAKVRRSSRISDPDIARWYSVAKENGALGGKIMGAGGGGFFMFCCPNGAKTSVRRALAAEGLREMPFEFDWEGSKVLMNF
jgi:D-glycero-alpha-D-manno-heptose-7-phosphate kinase